MQINLTINLERDELATLVGLLGIKSLDFQPSMLRRGPGGAVAAETAPDASRGANMPAPTETPVLAPVAPATDEGDSAPTTDAIISSALAAHGLAPLGESPRPQAPAPGILGWAPAATPTMPGQVGEPASTATDATLTPPTVPQRRTGRPSKQAPTKRPGLLPGDEEQPGRLAFADFDKLVRSEMKRLSMDGRMPNHRLWNDERNVLLPTMAGVFLRYDVTNFIDLAEKLRMQPPLSALGSNGVKVAAP